MTVTVGSGAFTYAVDESWEQIPEGWSHGDVSGIATDSQDRVYVFNRSDHPVMIYERDGTFVGSWGEGVFTRPHGITVTADDTVWCADDRDHTVRKFTLDGTLLQTIGTLNEASDTGYVLASGPNSLISIVRGAPPFNRPTRVAQAANGDLYISDGYGNARVHHFTADGTLLQSWGEPGDGRDQFNLPHSLVVHAGGRIFVCDRENDRIKVFAPDGELIELWEDVERPADIAIDRQDRVYISHLALRDGVPTFAGRMVTKSVPPQVSVREMDGTVLARWGDWDPFAPGSFCAPHALCVDSHGDIYVSETAYTALNPSGRYTPSYPAVTKLVRV